MIVGMTDATPKPKRKRWRWIIAGVLLVVVLGAGWWYWPRGDARFVGTWGVEGWLDEERYVFRSNGSGYRRSSANTPPSKIRFSWHVDGDAIVFRFHHSPESVQQLWSNLPFYWDAILGIPDRRAISNYAVDTFTMNVDAPWAPWTGTTPLTLRRIPE